MIPSPSPDAVALYWDFENLHASLIDQRYGAGTYFGSRFRPQEDVVDVAAVVEFALSLGPVAINRGFGNWASFSRYRYALLESAIELIQLFPPGASGKNGADIKLCLDVVEDMARYPHIGTFIVVGGDSDYMPLAHKVKAAGRTMVGIGSTHSTNQHWARSCHEFKFYETLVRPPAPAVSAAPPEVATVAVPAGVLSLGSLVGGAVPGGTVSVAPFADLGGAASAPAADAGRNAAGFEAPAPQADAAPNESSAAQAGQPGGPALAPQDIELRQLLDRATEVQERRRDARELVRRAIGLLSQRRGDAWVQKAGMRPIIQRMDSTFHESAYGCENFTELLAGMDDLIEIRRGEFDHEVRLRPLVSESIDPV
ncbi:MAG: NYN domain-containing protein [Leptothrix sp. (in: b-proteobacteria)]